MLKNHFFSRTQSNTLTFIIAFEVILNSVALSLTDFNFVGTSCAVSSDSSSERERWRAAPCLTIRSPHVCRSSNLAASDLITFCTSFFCDAIDSSYSSSSSSVAKYTMMITVDCHNAHKFQGLKDISILQWQKKKHNVLNMKDIFACYITLQFKMSILSWIGIWQNS